MRTLKLAHLGLFLYFGLTSVACPTRTIYYDAGGGAAGQPEAGGGNGGSIVHPGSGGSQAGGVDAGTSQAGKGGSPSGSGGTFGTGGTNLGSGAISGTGGTGTASGGVGGSPGSAGSTGGTGHAFTGSPCIMNQDGTEIVYAHGDDQGLYFRARTNGTWSPWSATQLDGSQIAPDSGISCSEGQGDVQIVAPNASPLGEMLYTEGNGAQFGAFQHLLGTESFSPLQAAISAGDLAQFYLVGAVDSGPQIWMNNQETWTELTPITSQKSQYVSAIDVALQPVSPAWLRIVVGFERSGQLAVYTNALYMGSGSWQSSGYVSPPPTRVFAFSPAICGDNYGVDANVHLVAVTENGDIWDAHYAQQAQAAQTGISAWELVGQGAASAVDCAIMPDSTVRIAALDSNGHAFEIQGSPGSWVQTDLGAY